jgi:hypothetical protein
LPWKLAHSCHFLEWKIPYNLHISNYEKFPQNFSRLQQNGTAFWRHTSKDAGNRNNNEGRCATNKADIAKPGMPKF